MSNLENLTAKILLDSDTKAREILDAAKTDADRISNDAVSQAEEKKEKIIADAKLQAIREAEQIVMGKTLAVRDENLGAKQKMLDKVFAEALVRLNNMPKSDFVKFLTDYLSTIELDDEEIILPPAYGQPDVDDLNASLKKAGRKGILTLSRSGRIIDSGFVLCKDGIEQNNTFEAMVAYYRYELESEVIDALY